MGVNISHEGLTVYQRAPNLAIHTAPGIAYVVYATYVILGIPHHNWWRWCHTKYESTGYQTQVAWEGRFHAVPDTLVEVHCKLSHPPIESAKVRSYSWWHVSWVSQHILSHFLHSSSLIKGFSRLSADISWPTKRITRSRRRWNDLYDTVSTPSSCTAAIM